MGRQRLGARITAVVHRVDGDDDRPLHSPTRLAASVANVEHLIGEPVKIYPPGTQSAETIARWIVPYAWLGIPTGSSRRPMPLQGLDAHASTGPALFPTDEYPAARVTITVKLAATGQCTPASGERPDGSRHQRSFPRGVARGLAKEPQ